MELNIYTDGASRGNPGKAGAGIAIFNKDTPFDTISKYLGKKTNNEAEYEALLLALLWIKEHKYENKKITIYADSQLMVKQLNGEYKVKAPTIIPLFRDAKETINKCKDIKFVWVRRDENKDADNLANIAIDSI